MDRSKQAWDEVGERFSSWGQLAAERYRKAGEQTQQEVEEAAKGLTEQLNRAFTALGDTIRDPEVKQDLTKAVKALGDAVGVTLTEAGEEIRRAIATERPPDEGPRAPGEGPPPDEGA